MRKVLLAGATGNLGKYLLQELKQQGYYVRVLVRSAEKAKLLSPVPDEVFIGDATDSELLKKICENMDVVISALGKSISLSDKSKATFRDIDFRANLNILHETLVSGVKQFIYTSAYTAEMYPKLAYFRAHANVTEALFDSRLTYTILQPTALFSAFDEVLKMAKNGKIASMGKGDKRTNPVF
ncbi:SDR family oxidoreductase [Pontibacter harenae]|uniref:SDR family oxidoreductase n=1 Tax=Pontibacter harenae TaxID=2894083 RepID=UPI001E3D0CC2|nr:NAD(P)H-binding protein [Pontibacter harenae]MCC9168115.1 NAD(P)H-binding protein [Pontibacter harenae]